MRRSTNPSVINNSDNFWIFSGCSSGFFAASVKNKLAVFSSFSPSLSKRTGCFNLVNEIAVPKTPSLFLKNAAWLLEVQSQYKVHILHTMNDFFNIRLINDVLINQYTTAFGDSFTPIRDFFIWVMDQLMVKKVFQQETSLLSYKNDGNGVSFSIEKTSSNPR